MPLALLLGFKLYPTKSDSDHHLVKHLNIGFVICRQNIGGWYVSNFRVTRETLKSVASACAIVR